MNEMLFRPGDVVGIPAWFLDPYKFKCREGSVHCLVLCDMGYPPTAAYLVLVCDRQNNDFRLTVEHQEDLESRAKRIGHIDISQLLSDDGPSGFVTKQFRMAEASLQEENRKLHEENEELRKECAELNCNVKKAYNNLYKRGFRYAVISEILNLNDRVDI